MVDKQGHYKHCFDDDRKLVTAEIQKKMLHEDGDPDWVNSKDNPSPYIKDYFDNFLSSIN